MGTSKNLTAHTFKVGMEELNFYPQEYLETLADHLGCEVSDLELIYLLSDADTFEDFDEMDSVEDLAELLNVSVFKVVETIEDNFDGVCIGSIEVVEINGVTVIAEQNAGPIGFWINRSNITKFKS